MVILPFPLIPILLGAQLLGTAIYSGANLYAQHNQRQLYSKQKGAYENLDKGYRSFLARQGRSVNPDRAWLSYYGQAQSLQTAIENSYASSVGTLGRGLSAGAGISRGFPSLYPKPNFKTSRWL